MTEDDIRSGTTTQSFARGKSYYDKGAVSGTIRRGNELEGQVQGSQFQPYRIHVVLLDQTDVISATCTCPYNWGGYCKHIVAVLLAYVHQPESFVERPPLPEMLMERSKEQLVDLIRQMILRYPDLQTLVDRPVPGAAGEAPVDTEAFRRELRQAIDRYSYDEWGESSVDSAIFSISAAAERFASAGDWRSARAIYSAIVDECLNGSDSLGDDEGEFITAMDDVLQKLAKCLDQPEIRDDDSERRAVLNCLIDAYTWDVKMGGQGLGDAVMPEALIKYAKQSDVAPLRKRIQAEQHRATASFDRWDAVAYENLLMDLDLIDNVDPEVTLQRLRDQELFSLLFDKLLQLNRFDEAIAVAEEELTTPFERLQVAYTLAAAGQDDAAVRLGQETLKSKFDYNLASWLAGRYADRHDRSAPV